MRMKIRVLILAVVTLITALLPACRTDVSRCCQSAKWDTFQIEHFGIIMRH